MKETYELRFVQLIRKTLNLSPVFNLSPMCYGNPANWDSIRHVEIFIALQKEFKLSFSADEIIKLNTYTALRASFLKKIQI